MFFHSKPGSSLAIKPVCQSPPLFCQNLRQNISENCVSDWQPAILNLSFFVPASIHDAIRPRFHPTPPSIQPIHPSAHPSHLLGLAFQENPCCVMACSSTTGGSGAWSCCESYLILKNLIQILFYRYYNPAMHYWLCYNWAMTFRVQYRQEIWKTHVKKNHVMIQGEMAFYWKVEQSSFTAWTRRG